MVTRRRLFGLLAAAPVVAVAALTTKGSAKAENTHFAAAVQRLLAGLRSKDNPFGSTRACSH